jgi:hypothetical protein
MDQLTIYGFGRTVLVWDDQNLNRSDLFVPANIKVGAPKNSSFFIGAKQTRLGLNLNHSASNHPLEMVFEIDFHNDPSDATGLIRMRHAYAKYRFFIVGMTWSNFFDEAVNPLTVDFEGPNSSTLSRTPQLRLFKNLNKNTWSLSLENPIEKISINDSVTALPERFPDIIPAYRYTGKNGFLKVAGLFRELRYQTDKPRSLYSYGATLMSSLNIGKSSSIKFQSVIGTGVSSYIQGSNGLNYDAISNGTNILKPLTMFGNNFSIQHLWNEHVNMAATMGFLNVIEEENLKNSNYKNGYYGAFTLYYSVDKNLNFGCEALLGSRINVDKTEATAIRLQMNITYKFNQNLNK